MFKALVLTGGNVNVTTKINDAGINDNDVGKAVAYHSTDMVALVADGDEIYGFISSISSGPTEDGKIMVTVTIAGRVQVTLDGDVAIKSMIEAAAPEAAGAGKAGNWAPVSIHTLDTTSAVTLGGSTFKKNWMLISGAGTDGTDGIAESQ